MAPNNWPQTRSVPDYPMRTILAQRCGRIARGWRAKTFGRGMQGQKPFFHVIEFWLENRRHELPRWSERRALEVSTSACSALTRRRPPICERRRKMTAEMRRIRREMQGRRQQIALIPYVTDSCHVLRQYPIRS